MFRNPLFHVAAAAIVLWLAFSLRACGAGRPIKDRRLAARDAAPLVQVGLGRCLRDPQVRLAVHGAYEIRGRKDVLAKGNRLPWVEVKAGDGISIGSTLLAENPVTIVPEEDG